MREGVRAEPLIVLALLALGLRHVGSPVLCGLPVVRHLLGYPHLFDPGRMLLPQPRELVLEIALRRARLVRVRARLRLRLRPRVGVGIRVRVKVRVRVRVRFRGRNPLP